MMNTPPGQLSLNLYDELQADRTVKVAAAIEALAMAEGAETRGAVFTRPEVVDFILDLVGYTTDTPLFDKRLLEPSFGGGDFLLRAVDRLMAAWHRARDSRPVLDILGNAIRSVELHRETYDSTYDKVAARLITAGMSASTASALTQHWLLRGDFLLTPLDGKFDIVVGNPPFVRQELIPAALLNEYRVLYSSIYDRADLYIPFIERSLSLLAPDGSLGFICADRWMKNRYGGPLRRLVAEHYHFQIYVDMVGTPAFQTEVTAYPAITVISRKPYGPTRIAHRPKIEHGALAALATKLRAPTLPDDVVDIRELASVTNGTQPWLLESADQLALIRRLEHSLPTIEEASCKVGIGVATGADRIFIQDFGALDVELDRKLPLVTTDDIKTGEVVWRGQGIINPFRDSGDLVNLDDYPRLRQYLEANREVITARHCAQKSPAQWYRTIDRITPVLAKTPKLLIPDIKGEAHVVYEQGQLYPHHNLYYVTAEEWELRALQAVLLSCVARLFITMYSTRMRGGFLRFQAQYLRRIRIPLWQDVAESLRVELTHAAVARDIAACNEAVFKLYAMSQEERSAFGGNGE